jgi:hypothetical protein
MNFRKLNKQLKLKLKKLFSLNIHEYFKNKSTNYIYHKKLQSHFKVRLLIFKKFININ